MVWGVVAVGPGFPVPPAGLSSWDDDWKEGRVEPRYVGIQARVGDFAVFYRKAAVDITLSHDKLVVVPHGAIVVLLRDDHPVDSDEPQ